jgi:glucose/arabinose dehydrogenase
MGTYLSPIEIKKLYRWSNDELTEVSGFLEVAAQGQRGLLDIIAHPQYDKNGWIYFSYSKPTSVDPNAKNIFKTAIVKAKLSEDRLEDVTEVFRGEPAFETTHHYGSRMVFDNEGYLYFSVGDRSRPDQNPQSLDNHCGKIHRINDDGSIPADNPFVKLPTAMPSVYSYGHRNPQGLVYNKKTKTLWEHEHGTEGGDQVNIIEKGRNYR